ncbi:MAG TPA: hypothetical protein VFJ96_09440 [Gemmatimonadaceae bacterium]|nr:hypothetical protein [Gemmatimonadaceae bacterium]
MMLKFASAALALPFLASLVAPATPTRDTRFAYAPGSHRYRLTTVIERTQAQAGGRAPFEFQTTTTQLVTVGLAPHSRDTLRFTVTLDSVNVSSTLAAPAPNLDRFRGITITGTISPQGKVYGFQPATNAGDAETADLYHALDEAFSRFFVEFPPRPLAVGSEWSDSSTERAQRNGFDVTTTTVTTTKLVGDTTVAGKHAWNVSRTSTLATTGQKTEAGEPIHLDGDGTISGVHFVSDDGVYLGSHSTQRINLTLDAAGGAGQQAPIRQTITSTVELVR